MGEAAVKEPSMEDILASIRRIIAEEGNVKEPQSLAAVEPPQFETPEPEVLEVPEVIDVQLEAGEAGQVYAEPVMEAGGAEPVLGVVLDAEDASAGQTLASHETDEEADGDQIAPPAVVAGDNSAAPPSSLEAEEIHTIHAIQTDQLRPAIQAEELPPLETAAKVKMADAVSAHHRSDETEAFKGALMSASTDDAVAGSFDRLKRSADEDIDARTDEILRPMLREWLDENLPTLVERLVREEIERVARGA